MIIRYLAPRQCRRLLFYQGPRALSTSRRALQYEPTSNELAFANHLQEAAIASNPQTESLLPEEQVATEEEEDELDDIARRDPKYLAQLARETKDRQRMDLWHQNQHVKRTTAKLGTDVGHYYRPVSLLQNPPRPEDVTLELLLASQAHLGHSTSLWHPANAQHIFGIRHGIHIISLDATAAALRRCAKIVSAVAEKGGVILFVGTRARQDRIVVRAAGLAGACHLFDKWIPGSITNGQQILGKCRMKVVDEFDREVPGFRDQMLDRAALKPDLVVCLNPKENPIMLRECGMAGVPTIGLVDTDTNPSWVTYAIPGNDDSMRTVQVVAGVLGRAGEQGQRRRREAAQRGEVTYNGAKRLEVPSVEMQEGIFSDEGMYGPASDGPVELTPRTAPEGGVSEREAKLMEQKAPGSSRRLGDAVKSDDLRQGGPTMSPGSLPGIGAGASNEEQRLMHQEVGAEIAVENSEESSGVPLQKPSEALGKEIPQGRQSQKQSEVEVSAEELASRPATRHPIHPEREQGPPLLGEDDPRMQPAEQPTQPLKENIDRSTRAAQRADEAMEKEGSNVR